MQLIFKALYLSEQPESFHFVPAALSLSQVKKTYCIYLVINFLSILKIIYGAPEILMVTFLELHHLGKKRSLIL